MSTDGAVHQTTTNGTGGNTRKPCPLHGCKRVYTDTTALESHIKDHEIPAKSLPGKVLLCSTAGCSSSFPNMQKLMEHMRHHHKPNIFFLCESCRTKLRSYRGLLTHLHTCSKVPRPKAKSNETVLPFATTGTNLNMTHVGMGQNPLHPDSVSKPQEIPLQTPNQDSPAPLPVSDIAAPPLRSLFSSNQDSLPAQQKLKKEASDLLPSLNLVGSAAALDPPDAQGQPQTQSVSTPQSPPGFSAVWKKSQGLTCNRRILWEHTKGRYKCVQCGHIVTNRKEMTQHINDQHRAAEDGGSSASNK